jgi:hypothetical protein
MAQAERAIFSGFFMRSKEDAGGEESQELKFSTELEATGLTFTSMRHVFQMEGIHGEAMHQ